MEDLARYILFTREKLNAVRAGIRAIDKLGIAKDVREQKKQEAQDMATALLDAETKLGELFSKLPKATPGKPHHKKFKNPTAGANKTK